MRRFHGVLRAAPCLCEEGTFGLPLSGPCCLLVLQDVQQLSGGHQALVVFQVPDEKASVSFRKVAGTEHPLDLFGQLEQGQLVRDPGPVLAQVLCRPGASSTH